MKGRRPIATSTTSASSTSAAPPAAGSIATFEPFRPLSTFVTLWPSRNSKPCFSSMRWNCSADLAVHARQDMIEKFDDGDFARRAGARPSRVRGPTTPAPTTSSLPGTLARASAPVEETICFSSISTPGSGTTSEPVAITMFLASSVCFAPSAAVTSTSPGALIVPAPMKASILYFLSRKPTPLTLAATVSSLCFIIAVRSSFGLPTITPKAASSCVGLGEFLRSLEQRLRRNAADVEAGAAMRLALFDDRDLQAELRRADGADIAAGAGADDDRDHTSLNLSERSKPR